MECNACVKEKRGRWRVSLMPTSTIWRVTVRWHCKLPKYILRTWEWLYKDIYRDAHNDKAHEMGKRKREIHKMRLSPTNAIHFGIFLPTLFTLNSFVCFILDFSQFLLCRLTSNHLRSSKKKCTKCFRHGANAIRLNSGKNVRSFIVLDRINNKGTPTLNSKASETVKYVAMHWLWPFSIRSKEKSGSDEKQSEFFTFNFRRRFGSIAFVFMVTVTLSRFVKGQTFLIDTLFRFYLWNEVS